MKKIALVIKSAPFSHLKGHEALDLALSSGSFEQITTIIFVADGVYHLQQNQQPELINAKPYLDTFKALSFYDVETSLVCEESLQQRSIATPLAFESLMQTPNEISAFLNSQDVVLSF